MTDFDPVAHVIDVMREIRSSLPFQPKEAFYDLCQEKGLFDAIRALEEVPQGRREVTAERWEQFRRRGIGLPARCAPWLAQRTRFDAGAGDQRRDQASPNCVGNGEKQMSNLCVCKIPFKDGKTRHVIARVEPINDGGRI